MLHPEHPSHLTSRLIRNVAGCQWYSRPDVSRIIRLTADELAVDQPMFEITSGKVLP